MNIMMLLEMAASEHGDRVAIVSGDRAVTFAELFSAVRNAAAEVRESGVQHLALLDVNSLAVPIGLFASACAGVPFVPLNYRLTSVEIEALTQRIAPAMLIADSEREKTLPAGSAERVVERQSFLSRHLIPAELEAEWPTEAEAIAILLFTSGTTGAPKAAVLRHKHLVSYIVGSVEFAGADLDEAVLVSVPPYHIAGMAAILSNIYAGRRVVQLPQFDPKVWLETARRERVTHAFTVPTMLARVIDTLGDAPDAGLPHLRALSYGGGKMPLGVIERAMRLLPNCDLTNAYGLTETSSTITLLGPEDHRKAAASDDPVVHRRLTSVGRPLPGVELEIRDTEGKPLPPGERGEIYVRGEQVSGEYLGVGKRIEGEGWFPTRDAGWIDEEGYVFLDGRIDDVIVRGGENLSPGEIEEVLLAHEAVADCAVVGIPDEEWGEAVAAAIVLRPGHTASEDELRELVRSQLRSSRVPAKLSFRDELPYNETGKLLRRVIRAELAADGR